MFCEVRDNLARLTASAWTSEDGSGRSTVEVVAEKLGAKPAMGDDDQITRSQDHYLTHAQRPGIP
jgi:hypothetical protein